MDQDAVVALMKSATSEHDWNAKARQVKAACGGYPAFWFAAIVMSGLLNEVKAKWEYQGAGHVDHHQE